MELRPALDALGKLRRIEELSWKPFPTGRAAHGAIIAFRQLIAEHGITAATLKRFTYRAPPLIHRLVGRRPFAGMSVAYARLCFAWLGALVLTRGTVDLADFTPERLARPRTARAGGEDPVVEVDGNPDPAAFVPALGIATTIDGAETYCARSSASSARRNGRSAVDRASGKGQALPGIRRTAGDP